MFWNIFPVPVFVTLFTIIFGMGEGAGPSTGSIPRSLTAPDWAEVVPGVAFARVRATRYCRQGSTGVAVVRMDPNRCRIEPYHETEYSKRATILDWQERLHTPVLLNGGLYDANRRHLGILRRRGRDLGGNRHETWKGVLALDPRESELPPAALLDLASPGDVHLEEKYGTAVQSMMLFDTKGDIRVRKSDRIARRSAVAMDKSGRIFLLVTEGAYTLWDTGALLHESGFELVEALALDGGNEASLVVNANGVRYRSFENDRSGADPSTLVTLPSILALRPELPAKR